MNLLKRYAASLVTVAIIVGLLLAVTVLRITDWPLLVSIAGSAVTLVYSIHSQRREEIRLFKELFTEFNSRYDKLNNELDKIRKDRETPLTPDQIRVLVHYFNLCAEEYMFYKEGYIKKDVWGAWLNGMQFYYQDRRIAELWDQELSTDSYYGMTHKILRS